MAIWPAPCEGAGEAESIYKRQREGATLSPGAGATASLCLFIFSLVDKPLFIFTVRLRGIGTGISEAIKRVTIFSFATQGGKQVSSYFRQRSWVQAREAQIRFPAG